MAYAELDDIANILPAEQEMPEEDSQEETVLLTALEEATDLVIAYLGCDEMALEDVPPAVRRVVARVAMRGFLDEPMHPGAASEVNLMGPFSHSVTWSREIQARDFYLTDADKDRLERFRCSASGGRVIHMAMSTAADDTTYCGDYWDGWVAE